MPFAYTARADAAQTREQTQQPRAQYAVGIGNGIGAKLLDLPREPPDALYAAVLVLGVGHKEVDIETVEERAQHRARKHRDPDIGIGLVQCTHGMRQHRHIAKSRETDHDDVARQLRASAAIAFRHKARG